MLVSLMTSLILNNPFKTIEKLCVLSVLENDVVTLSYQASLRGVELKI